MSATSQIPEGVASRAKRSQGMCLCRSFPFDRFRKAKCRTDEKVKHLAIFEQWVTDASLVLPFPIGNVKQKERTRGGPLG